MFEQVISLALSLPLLLYVAVALVSVWYIKLKNRLPENAPPLPIRPYPILGHITWMNNKDTIKTLKQWTTENGGIFSIYMGHKHAVVIGSYQILKEAFVKNAEYFTDRAHRFIDTDDRFFGGVVDTSGALWKEQRGVMISILKQFGMGKNVMGERINIEVKECMEVISNSKGEPTNIRGLVTASVANVIVTILIGKRFDLGDPQGQYFFQILSEQFKYLQGGSALKVFPWLKFLPGDFFHAKAMLRNEEIFRSEFSMKYIQKIRDHSEGPNFIKSYLDEEKSRKESGQETTLDEQNLTMIITNLFQAGTETSSTTIMWALLYAIYHPETQKKLHHEIDTVIGTENLPSVEEKNKLKYVNAFLLETQRLASVAPLLLPHVCTKTSIIGGYTIPEGTMIMPFLDSMFHGPMWENPLVFRPERFLNREGDLVVPEHFIPFGLGRRLCPGDAIAKLEMLLFLIGIFQKFHVLPEDPDNLPSLEPVFGLVCAPKPYKLKFVPRHC